MANLIQIKRSDATATPTSLANGELAFSGASNVLFVGIKNSVVPIAGARSPGTLVANQAIVVNASSLIDTIKVGNTGTNVTTNTGGIFLANSTSNTRLTIPSTAEWTSGSYWLNANGQWSTIPAAATSLDGLNDVTITSVANNDFLIYNNTTSQWINKAAGNGFAFSSQSPYVLANNGIISNTTGVWVDSANGIVVSSDGVNVLAGNSQIVSNTTGVWISGVTSSQIVGDIALGSQTSGSYVASITAGAGLTGDGTGEGSTPTLAVGAANGITVAADAISVTAGNGVFVSTAGVNVLAGNSQVVSNTTGVWISGVTSSQIAGDIALGTQTSGSYVATITAGAGLTGDGTGEGSTPTLAVGTANGITVAADAISVKAGNAIFTTTDGVNVLAGTGVVTNATGVHIGQAVGTTSSVTFQDLTVNGNTALGSDTADRVSINGYVNTAIIPEANNTRDLGATGLRWNNIFAKDITANNLTIGADVSISGNLTVSGVLVTLDVTNLSVEDPLIELARNNNSTDSLDIGFYGHYNVGGGDPEHAGLFRDASDNKFKLFTGLTTSPTTIVDTGGVGYTQGTLVTYLESGGLITNATHVALTSNSTVNVSITANNLTLSSPLVGTSGGTGLASYTAEDILVANSSNGFRKLAVGSEGFVLQVSSGVVTYNSLDGGTF